MRAIEMAIGELVEEIRVRQDAVVALQKLGPLALAVPVVPTIGNGSRVERAMLERVKGKKRPARGGKGAHEEAARGLSEPFGPNDLARVTGLSAKSAGTQLWRWAHNGMCVKMGVGQYRRTAKFGGAVPVGAEPRPAGARVAIPGLDAKEASLEEQIKQACLERDAAVTAGRDRLGKILQDKVDRLQRQLEGE